MSSLPISDRDILIAEYTLGLLNDEETSKAQRILGDDPHAALTALQWEHNFLALVDLLPPVVPKPESLARLKTTLGHRSSPPLVSPALPTPQSSNSPAEPPASQPALQAKKTQEESLTVAAALRRPENTVKPSGPEPAPPTQSLKTGDPTVKPPIVKSPNAQAQYDKGNIWLWRGASLVLALIAITLALIPAKPVEPAITVVQVAPTRAAILQAPGQSSTPGWVVTIDPQGNVLMAPQVRSDIPANSSVQLWTSSRNLPQPRSLGLIDPNQPVTVPASLMGEISADQLFEMTQEPAGGSPTASPSGPILFIGRIVTFGKPLATPNPNTTTVP
ncbi:hypothetical protein EKL30_17990 [Candidimonas sp. SYP-B2681]|uniref:anti-sigma factor n=1 Tax=Candidimonas sp. SYP-B2681 TaxID=2497686 RepID=UPI000F871336|nr:anti-sigma factor [Candidimonas sp. SYP-B2681]RTZ39319.1 hypothetical protein EKL30_17990 [Candidimonas sp. SYP-B2681]